MNDPQELRPSADVATQPATDPIIPLAPPLQDPAEVRFLKYIVLGPQGLRAGWAALLFMLIIILTMILYGAVGSLFKANPFHQDPGHVTAVSTVSSELGTVLGIIAAMAVLALIERRRIVSYYLNGPRNLLRFLAGAAGGFVAVSVLIGLLYKSGFLHFGPATLTTPQIFQYGAIWGLAFLLVGLSEEGTFRCYFLFTLARGMNFWWSGGSVAALCLFAVLNPQSNGAGGVYLMASLGVIPCLLLHLKRSPSSGFWQAAWFTSTAFGYVHTFNQGESWIGIFSAAAIGFIFCVSIRLTGSVWFAIGFHGAWDWAQTFFYGTPDSGLLPEGHYLTTTPSGAVLWSGGSAGPEGSILILPILALILLVVVLIYGRRGPQLESPSPAAQPQLS